MTNSKEQCIKLIQIPQQDISNLTTQPAIAFFKEICKTKQEINLEYEFDIEIKADTQHPLYVDKQWIKYITIISESCPAFMFFLTNRWRNVVFLSVCTAMEGLKNNKPNLIWEPKKVATFLSNIDTQLNYFPFLYEYGDKLINWVKYKEIIIEEVTGDSNIIPINKSKVIKISKHDIFNLDMKNIYNDCKEILYTKQDVNTKYIIITSAFDNDNRELYCIPQWIKYIKLVMEKYPVLIFFMENEFKELILLSITDFYMYIENSNEQNLNLIKEKIKYFLKNLAAQVVQMPYILNKSRENEWEKFLQYFSNKIDFLFSLKIPNSFDDLDFDYFD